MANIIATAGGGAGMMEALACHPLGMLLVDMQSSPSMHAYYFLADTIKVRMQLSRRARVPGVCYRNLFAEPELVAV